MAPVRQSAATRAAAGSPDLPVVDEAPLPALAGLDGLDDRMARRPCMPAGVTILGGVAASDESAMQAHAQVDPGVTHRHAGFADGTQCRLRLQRGDVVAGFDV